MKAAYVTGYGSPEMIEMREVAHPVPGQHEVLVRQMASTVSPADCAMRSGKPYLVRLFTGLARPKLPIPGGAVAGVVEAVGSAVTSFRPGQRVFGTTDPEPGAMAEYVVIAEDGALAQMPEGLRFEEAGGITYSFMTAMPFLRDEAKLQPGQSILINGAAGSIGGIAVQIARGMGAEVTAVCSAHNADLVRSLGAHHVIDRHKVDFTKAGVQYDVIFDSVGKSSFAASRSVLKPGGIYLTTVPSLGILLPMLRGADKAGKRGRLATTGLRKTLDKRADMAVLAAMVARGELRATIDRTYKLAEIAAAHAYVEAGTKAGDVIICFPAAAAGG